MIVTDAANDDTFAKITLSLGTGGNLRAASCKALGEAQYREIIGAIC